MNTITRGACSMNNGSHAVSCQERERKCRWQSSLHEGSVKEKKWHFEGHWSGKQEKWVTVAVLLAACVCLEKPLDLPGLRGAHVKMRTMKQGL